ncbi:glycosyltransferase [bacterium]|nr:glycosyltransferase [bacterium]
MKIKVFILTKDRIESLKSLLSDLENGSKKTPNVEIKCTVLFNGSTLHLWQQTQQEIQRDDYHLLWLPKGLPLGAARNYALSRSQMDASFSGALFLDDDVRLPEDYFKSLFLRFKDNPEISFIGGPNLDPPDTPLFGRIVSEVFAESWVCGEISDRYRKGLARSSKSFKPFILCNLFMSKHTLEQFRFSNALVAGEENEILARVTSKGKSGFYDPKVYVFHERRSGGFDTFSQIFKYGLGGGLAALEKNHRDHSSLKWRVTFFLFVFTFLALALWQSLAFAAATLGSLYASYLLVSSLKIIGRTKKSASALVILLIPMIQWTYVCGRGSALFTRWRNFSLKLSLRYWLSKIVPKPLALLIYRILGGFATSALSSPESQAWCRNSLVFNSIRFAKSDIDLTLHFTNSQLREPLIKKYYRLKKALPFVGEILFYDSRSGGKALSVINPIELRQDPTLLRLLKKSLHRTATDRDGLVFILRKLESNAFDLIHETKPAKDKWERYLASLPPFEATDFFSILNHLAEQNLLNADEKETIFSYLLLKAYDYEDFHVEELGFKDFLIQLFPHRYCYAFQDGSLDLPLKKRQMICAQLRWECWGLLTSPLIRQDERLSTHVNHLERIYKSLNLIDKDLEEALKDLSLKENFDQKPDEPYFEQALLAQNELVESRS